MSINRANCGFLKILNLEGGFLDIKIKGKSKIVKKGDFLINKCLNCVIYTQLSDSWNRGLNMHFSRHHQENSGSMYLVGVVVWGKCRERSSREPSKIKRCRCCPRDWEDLGNTRDASLIDDPAVRG